MRVIAALALLCLLNACQTPRAVRLPADYPVYQQQLQALSQWQISGRILYKDSNEKHSAYISWQQDDADYSMVISTLIGSQIMALRRHDRTVALTLDEQTYRDRDASRLLWRFTGWQMPVDQFPQWVKGLATPNALPLFADQGWLHSLRYQGWTITYYDFRQVKDFVLPHQLLMHDDTHQIKIKISQWTLN